MTASSPVLLAPSVSAMLAQHGLASVPERPAPGGGYTASRLTVLEQQGRRWWLKRIAEKPDWLMRALHDTQFREAQFAVSPLAARLPPAARTPTLGAAYDGGGRALLLRDVPVFPDDARMLSRETLSSVLAAAADLHAAFWDDPLAGAGVDFTAVRDRLLLLTPARGDELIAEGLDFGLAGGWQAFRRTAPAPAVDLVDHLFDDPGPLLARLEALPATLVHGDLKVSNMALADRGVWLIDWQAVAHAPVAVEMSWFLAVNSSRLPAGHDETLARYAELLRLRLGPRWSASDWQRQLEAVYVCGLMAYGWGKALDSEAGRGEELQWWCERATAVASKWY